MAETASQKKSHIEWQFPEHKSPGAERFRLVDTVDLDDEDEENTAQVCYFIVGGDEYDTFSLDRLTHELMVRIFSGCVKFYIVEVSLCSHVI